MSAIDPSIRHQRREQALMVLLASPAVLVIICLLVIPVGWLMAQSVYDNGFTLDHYRRIFTEEVYARSFFLTFRIAFLVTFLTLILGYPAA